jgi:hypothetical protein
VRGIVGAALLATCLHAGAASALSFNFTFTGQGSPIDPGTVTGIVDGLVDNLNNQGTGLSFTITSATNTPAGGWQVFTTPLYGGINVSGGQATGSDIIYENNVIQRLYLGNQNLWSPLLFDTNTGEYIRDLNNTPTNSLVFSPVSSAAAPGPLPLFGAAAAFGWSRKLRRRIKTSV